MKAEEYYPTFAGNPDDTTLRADGLNAHLRTLREDAKSSEHDEKIYVSDMASRSPNPIHQS